MKITNEQNKAFNNLLTELIVDVGMYLFQTKGYPLELYIEWINTLEPKGMKWNLWRNSLRNIPQQKNLINMKHKLTKSKENGFTGTATYQCDKCGKQVFATMGSLPEDEECGDKRVDKINK